jgi:hypothetical protein
MLLLAQVCGGDVTMTRAVIATACLLLLLAAPSCAAAIECRSSMPAAHAGGHWTWRLVDGRRCWYAGERALEAENARPKLEPPPPPQPGFADRWQLVFDRPPAPATPVPVPVVHAAQDEAAPGLALWALSVIIIAVGGLQALLRTPTTTGKASL